MNRVDLYIDGQRVDFFDQESIELTMSVQNVKDISKVFGDFSKSFTLPASPNNNAVFKHYYNVDVSGGFDANTRTSAFIELNNNVFRSGVIELEGVQLKNLQPYAYKVGFYSKTTSLKDLFGEDTLNDLDLSALDHAYNDTNIVTEEARETYHGDYVWYDDEDYVVAYDTDALHYIDDVGYSDYDGCYYMDYVDCEVHGIIGENQSTRIELENNEYIVHSDVSEEELADVLGIEIEENE